MAKKKDNSKVTPITEATIISDEAFLPEIEATPLELPINLLYEFTNAAAVSVDVLPLMAHFFNILRHEIDFDIGAYLLDSEEDTEARIFKKGDLDSERLCDFSELFLKRAPKFSPYFYRGKLDKLGVSVLLERSDSEHIDSAGQEGPAHSLELPIKCFGEAEGVITLISFKSDNPFENTELIDLMVEHAASVLERILSQRNDTAKKLGMVLSKISDGVFIVERDGRLTSANSTGLDIISNFCKNHIDCIDSSFGLGEALPENGSTCEYVEFLSSVRSLDPIDDIGPYTKEITNEDGLILSLSSETLEADNNSGRSITVKDITEEKQLEKSMMLTSKLASLGEMAAGIAHEINNPLQTILGNIEMLEMNIKGKEQGRVVRVKDGVLRIREIVKDLLSFSRDQTDEDVVTDINIVIQKALDISSHQLKGTNIKVVSRLDTKPLTTTCNPNLLQQVIINLIQNARDAIVEAGKGKSITIKTGLLPGKTLGIEIADDGPGIPEAIVERIFDPLFTTKEVGKGTGLGLSLSKKIIEKFGGKISVTSARRKGTTFRIMLPCEGRQTKTTTVDTENLETYARLVGKSVLMVDDEEEFLSATSSLIAKNVFKLDTAGNGTEAMKMIKSSDYDFILLDIKMPKMDGKELFKKIIKHNPRLKERVIFITADVNNPETSSFLRLSQCRFLAKPFNIRDLLHLMIEIDDMTEKPIKLKAL